MEYGGVGVRVVTWNVRGAGRPDPVALARVLFDVGADLVALQEVRRSQAEQLSDLLDLPEWRWLIKHRPFGPLLGGWAEGLAVLSRFPIASSSASVLTPGVPMRSFRRRVVQDVVVTTGVGPLRFVNTHLSSDDDGDRARQAELLVDLLAKPVGGVPTARTVLAGDLNAVDEAAVIGRLLAAGLTDAWAVSGAAGGGPTNPADAPHQRLDHVMVGADLTVRAVEVPIGGPEWAALSDHLPVTAALAIGAGR